MLNLPDDFESYDDARKAGFVKMKEYKEQGGRVVGVFCTFVPIELILAAGAVAVSLCATSEAPIAAAEADLPRNLCPLIKASYGFAKTDTCPYFYFSDFIVGETTCDGKKKMFELMNEIKETYVMQLPNGRSGASMEAWKSEIIALKVKLEDYYGVTITEEAIREAIVLKNKEREIMLRYLDLGKLNPAPLSGYELSTRSDALGFNLDIRERCAFIEKRTEEVLANWEANLKGTTSTRPRILVTGCPNGGVREKILKTVEELGADVVAFDNCGGTREKIVPVRLDIPVMDALAEKYLNINCSVMSPNTSRIDYIREMARDYQVDGVIEIILQACHTYNVEAHYVKKAVTEMGLPYLMIETDYSQADKGQISTRLSAFLETIED